MQPTKSHKQHMQRDQTTPPHIEVLTRQIQVQEQGLDGEQPDLQPTTHQIKTTVTRVK